MAKLKQGEVRIICKWIALLTTNFWVKILRKFVTKELFYTRTGPYIKNVIVKESLTLRIIRTVPIEG